MLLCDDGFKLKVDGTIWFGARRSRAFVVCFKVNKLFVDYMK